MFDYDLLVLGAGSGGVACARRAASHGARVAIVEQAEIGGTCVHRGCIPKKFLVYASHFAHDLCDSKGYGWNIKEYSFSWPDLVSTKSLELQRLEGIYRSLLLDSGVKIFQGHGHLQTNTTLKVNSDTISAENILLATGGWPTMPNIDGIHLAINSNDIFDLPSKPDRIVVVGGGYIACELAAVFNGLGSEVTQLYRSEMILRGFDDEIRKNAYQEMLKSGIDIRLGQNVASLSETPGSLRVNTTSGGKISADQVLFAIGRKPNTSNIGLLELGVSLNDNGAVNVNEGFRSSISNIYAIGDCTDRLNLTPVAIHEGRCLAETLFNSNPQFVDYRNVPTAIFTQPEIGIVGLSEEQARKEFGNIKVFKAHFRPLKHTLTGRETKVFVKLVVDVKTDRVLGCHMIGDSSSEIVQALGVALQAGATKAQFDQTMAVHPTSAEELVTMY